MHLIICLSATINNIPEKAEKAVYSLDISLPEPNKTTASTVNGKYKDGGKFYLYCFKHGFYSLLIAYKLICHVMKNINFKCC